MNQKEIQDLIKELGEIESLIEIRPARAIERLDQLIISLRKSIQ